MIAGIAFNAILITEYGNEIPKNVSAVRCNKSDKPVNPPGIRFPARTKDLMLTDISNDAKSTQQSNTLFLAQSAMIAAIYVVLTVILAPFSYGEVQVRVSEALTILPVFTPAAIPGLFVGCLISNILGGCILPDIIFGSIATLLGACFTYLLRNRNKFLAPLPPIISNILIVPFVLHYGYQVPLPIPFLMGTVGIGEVISCGILGMIVYTILDKHRVAIFRTAA